MTVMTPSNYGHQDEDEDISNGYIENPSNRQPLESMFMFSSWSFFWSSSFLLYFVYSPIQLNNQDFFVLTL